MKGSAHEIRIAQWCTAPTLRSRKHFEEALFKPMALKTEYESTGESDGYILEELGECLLGLQRVKEACPYFMKANEILAQDTWLAE